MEDERERNEEANESIRFSCYTPRTKIAQHRNIRVLGNQLLRCGTSVGANYRASCRAKSQADFIAKMGIVEEEADESMYWMELLVEAGLVQMNEVTELVDEANQIVAIIVSSINTARGNKR